MSQLHSRIAAFAKLGDFLFNYCENAEKTSSTSENDNPWFARFNIALQKAHHENGWFTKKNVLYALNHWASLLKQSSLDNWLLSYSIAPPKNKKTVALIMAGNIPLVGFHDLLCVLCTGHNALVKQSSNDQVLLPLLLSYAGLWDRGLEKQVTFTDKKLDHFDAVIATGSNNTARYFEYYFSKNPHIIRKNRNSVAVLNGNETHDQLLALGQDIFGYFGLGCRSVSKIFVPKGYDFDPFFKAIYAFNEHIHNHKYANNYDYNKAVYLMSEYPILDNGFLILKEDAAYASPIATLFYEHYSNKEQLLQRLQQDGESLQCVVANGLINTEVPFGRTQKPILTQYADGVDTIQFLLKI